MTKLIAVLMVMGILAGCLAWADESARNATQLDFTSLPERGAVITELPPLMANGQPDWWRSLVSGNGEMGAIMFGIPGEDAIVLSHEKCYLDSVKPFKQADMRAYVAEARAIWRAEVAAKGGNPTMKVEQFLSEKRKEQRYSFFDPFFHPGFKLMLKIPMKERSANGLTRFEDFTTGEAVVRWSEGYQSKTTHSTHFERRLFVSRADRVAVLWIRADRPGNVSLTLGLDQSFIANPTQVQGRFGGGEGVLTFQGKYLLNEGGYAGLVRIVPRGGTVRCLSDHTMTISKADEVVVLMGLQPSLQWAACPGVKDRNDLDAVLAQLRQRLEVLPADYTALLRPHALAHGALFNRARLDLGGGEKRLLPTNELLARARYLNQLSPALLEKMYDASRYLIISTCGDWPPNLQGKFAGAHGCPPWMGSYTLDTNLECAMGSALSANLPECMNSLFNYCEFMVPDWRENAKLLFGARGILASGRCSSTGKIPGLGKGTFCTSCAPWLAHFFYDYYLYTGDKEFLAKRCVPFLKECALFYEDYKVTDPDGTWRFSPNWSPEVELGENANIDIGACREVLLNLAAAYDELGIEKEQAQQWRAKAACLPNYRIDPTGLGEYSAPGSRAIPYYHYSPLYPLMYTTEFDPHRTPELWAASRKTFEARLLFIQQCERGRKTACLPSFSRIFAGMCANRFGEGEITLEQLKGLATDGAVYPTLLTSHWTSGDIPNMDAAGSIAELVNGMLIYSERGRLDLLPALPAALPKGEIRGILARGQLTIDRLSWDQNVGLVNLEVTSAIAQKISLALPKEDKITGVEIRQGAATVEAAGESANKRVLILPQGGKCCFEIRHGKSPAQ